jgi:pyruvate kinase
MNYQNKNTKIVGRISDLRCETDFLTELYDNGFNGVWTNAAHQTPETTKQIIDNVRSLGKPIPIMIDTKGPEIRTLDLGEGIPVQKGDKVRFTDDATLTGEDVIGVSYEHFVRDIPVGSELLVDDGDIKFTVLEKNESFLTCSVDNSGVVKKKKSVNIPNVHIDLPTLTERDKLFLEVAAKENCEYVTHSFVRSKDDVLEVRAVLDSFGGQDVKIIAKIENREGVENIDEILDYCEGAMVARGDLAIEVRAAEVPLMQKKIVEACLKKQKLSMVATQMLHSMIENPRPTRAEVTDVANAIMEGADIVCLSGETAYGEYPIEAVRTMSEIAVQLHERPRDLVPQVDAEKTPNTYLARAAVEAAVDLDLAAIVVPSITGKTATYISALRARKPIYVMCNDERIRNQLSIRHGISTFDMDIKSSTDEIAKNAVQILLDAGKVSLDDMIAIISGRPSNMVSKSMFLEIISVKEALQ